MYTLYSLLLTVGFIILLPKFALDALSNGKYVTGLKERLGNLSLTKSDNPVVWLHCVSVGEAQAAQSLVRALGQNFPRHDLAISTTTVTGQQMARSLFGEQAAIFYFPIDWAWTVRRAMRMIQPSAVFVMETEVWPRLFRECRKQDIPVALLNGRLSEKSFRRYKLVRSFISRVLNDLTVAAVQTSDDADRFRELGLAKERIKVFGNLKFDSASISTDSGLTEEIRARFAFDKNRPLIVAASTHAPEEMVVLQAFKQARHSHPAARLLVAPRHPERFHEVAALLEESVFMVGRRSAPKSDSDAQDDIVLLDTIGELRDVYPLADIVFMGGSLIPHGGQNVIEPAAHGICTITGPHTHNFAAVTKAMLDENALIQLTSASDSASELASVLTQFLSDGKRRHEIGERAKAVCRRNQGATGRSVELISQILSAPAKGDQEIQLSTLHVTAAK